MTRCSEIIKKFESFNEGDKTLIRGLDRLLVNKTAKHGNDVRLMAVDNGKTISLHLKYKDGEKIVELPKTKGSVMDFESELKKKGFIPLATGKLEIKNESFNESDEELIAKFKKANPKLSDEDALKMVKEVKDKEKK